MTCYLHVLLNVNCGVEKDLCAITHLATHLFLFFLFAERISLLFDGGRVGGGSILVFFSFFVREARYVYFLLPLHSYV